MSLTVTHKGAVGQSRFPVAANMLSKTGLTVTVDGGAETNYTIKEGNVVLDTALVSAVDVVITSTALGRMPAHQLGAIVGRFEVTPSDTINLPRETRQIYVGGAGNIVIVWADGTSDTYAVAAGAIIDGNAKRINSTNTTATSIEGWY